ncbi:MAG: hypothetical protein IJK02_07125 [Clostridia bacterium]|nr:hypothetical protein [Clostridia bacterium]MBR0538007.1 hypothetical protein [Clostridia bacterium]
MKKILSGLIAALLLCLTAAGCSKSEALVLYFLTDAEPGTFDPQIASDSTADAVVRNCFEGLVCLDDDGNVQPAAAERWEKSADGRVYTFYLRPGARWHVSATAAEELADKLPENFAPALTAEDFRFALRRALDPATGVEKAGELSNILNGAAVLAGEKTPDQLGVTAPQSDRLVIELEQPQEEFLRLLTQPMCMPCNETFFNACGGRYGRKIRYIISNGPFFLTRFDENGCRIAKNPDYVGVRPAEADVIWLNYFRNMEDRISALENDGYAGGFLPTDVLDRVHQNGRTTLIREPDGMRGFLFNCENALLKEPLLRAAIIRSADITALCSDFSAVPAQQVLPASVGGAPALPLTFNEASAKETLADALEKLGRKSVSLTILCEERFDRPIRRMLQTWQRIFGIELNLSVQTLSAEDLAARIAGGDYEIAFTVCKAENAVAADYAQQLFALSRCDDAAGVRIVESLRYIGDTDREKTLASFQKMIADSFIFLPAWEEDTCFYCADDVVGVQVQAGSVVYLQNARLNVTE